jgi:biotin carboxyl carrier protein
VEVAVERGAAGGPPAGRGLSSPTPATVARVFVAVGEAVEAGQALLVLVAMKTELTLSAPRAGTVLAIHAVPGSAVRAGVPLVELGP